MLELRVHGFSLCYLVQFISLSVSICLFIFLCFYFSVSISLLLLLFFLSFFLFSFPYWSLCISVYCISLISSLCPSLLFLYLLPLLSFLLPLFHLVLCEFNHFWFKKNNFPTFNISGKPRRSIQTSNTLCWPEIFRPTISGVKTGKQRNQF